MDGLTAADFSCKSVKELREILQRRRVDYSDCVEKTELVARILETHDKEPKGPQTKQGVKIGPLTCSTVSNCIKPDYIVVLSHGLGANAQDLLPIATEAIGNIKANILFVFPNAPLPFQGAGFAWWEIDFQRLMTLAMSMQFEAIMDDSPAVFLQSSEKLQTTIKELVSQYSVPYDKVILGGFSQGAMMSVDVSLKLPEPVRAVFAWSPGFINRQEWLKLAPARKGMTVYHSHGKKDQVIPFPLAMALKTQLFEANGFKLDWFESNDGHTIAPQSMSKFSNFLQGL